MVTVAESIKAKKLSEEEYGLSQDTQKVAKKAEKGFCAPKYKVN